MPIQIIKVDEQSFEIWKNQITRLLDMSVRVNFPNSKVDDAYGTNKCRQLASYLKEGSAVVFAAVKDGQLLGWIWAHQILRINSKRLHIAEIAVDEAYHSHGIGKMLLNIVEEYAGQNGFHEIDLMVSKSNDTAIRFYEKSAFEVERYLMKKSVETKTMN